MRTIAVAAGIALAAGCGSVDTIAAPDARASDATHAPDAPDNTSCTQACLSETSLRACTGGERTVECSLGCVTAEARCRTIVPSNGASMEHLMGVTGAFTIAEAAQVIVDTDLGAITVGGEDVRGHGVGVNDGIGFQYTADGLSVLAVQGMTMAAGSNLRARGDRPLLILSAGDVEIAGTIDVSAGCDSGSSATQNVCGGPGGGHGANANAATGCGPGGNGSQNGTTSDYGGGGGGGSGQAGAAGAAAQDGAGGNGGQAREASLVPLRGGSGGGQGSTSRAGGGGGGAVQITSFTALRLVSPAVIDAGGSRGVGYFYGGSGGGSGGGILLEAPVLSIDGAVLAANGGGGGGGNYGSTYDGSDGRRDVQQARGGTNGGGLGGALAGSPTPGTLYSSSSGGGGGGGAAGMIHLRAPAAGYSLTNSAVSPAPTRIDPEPE